MSNEVAIAVEGMSLAEAMGISASAGSKSTLARVAQVQTALTVTDKEGDEHIKVPVGSYKVTMPDGEIVYSKTITIRLFSQRQQWQRFDSASNTMHKSLLHANLNVDLKDTTGKFNLGRPSGYIKDFASLPEAMKGVIRNVKRVKVMLGMVSLDKATDEVGNVLKDYNEDMPFVMDVRNNESIKAMDSSISQIIAKKLTPIEHTIKLGNDKRDHQSGVKYAIIVPSLGTKVSYGTGDSDTLRSFLDWVTSTNNYIEGKFDEVSAGSISPEEAAIVGSIVEVKEFEG